MEFRVTANSTFNCTLERAFKTPMLCDVSKVHSGYGIMPKVTHCTEDENWGKPGFTKKVFVSKSLTQKGGWASVDKVIERMENKYWKIEVSNFQTWMLGFTKFEGLWKTTELTDNKVLIEYQYILYATSPILYPLNWLFSKVFWKTYMERVLENVRKMAENNDPYIYK
jgi:hypothetical protein